MSDNATTCNNLLVLSGTVTADSVWVADKPSTWNFVCYSHYSRVDTLFALAFSLQMPH